MIRLSVTALVAFAVSAGAAEKPRISRLELAAVEKTFNSTIQRLDIKDPYDLLGLARGVYLDGYGAVFSAEVNLITGPLLLQFRPALTEEEIGGIRLRKAARLPLLRQKMRESLLMAAVALPAIPATEQIVLSVSLFFFSWENHEGMPTQIVMRAPRQSLLELGSRHASDAVVASIVHVEELN